jgi:hypothetical protein
MNHKPALSYLTALAAVVAHHSFRKAVDELPTRLWCSKRCGRQWLR